MNVLKRIIVPRLEQTIHYILLELEELEREDTFRLKRVKQNNMKRTKQNGGGERMEVINEEPNIDKTDIPETKSIEPEATGKPDEVDIETKNEDKESISVQPKEAAEMGDLVVIKPADDGSEVGDNYAPQTGLNMDTLTEATVDQIEMNDKENIKGVEEFELEKREGQTKLEDDVVNEDLEAGEWFETVNKIEDKPPELLKIDKYEEAVETKRLSDDTNSVPDLDKRGLASLYKGIDSNFYKPTIDDLFSKHDIAMRDSSNDISLISHSLVDLESIDFSIDSQGKVVSRHETEKSSPALSYREVDATKQTAMYDKAGMLIIPKSSTSNLKLQGEGQTEDVTQSQALITNDNDEGSKMTTGDVVKPGVDERNTRNNIKESQNLEDKNFKLNDIDEHFIDDSTVNYEDNKTNETENIQENKSENEVENKVKADKNLEEMAPRILSSTADEKLSKISEEENIDAQEIIEVEKVEQQIHETVNKDNIHENFKLISSARSSRDIHNKNLQYIGNEQVLNPIVEETEVFKNVKQMSLEHQLRDSTNNVNKTKNENELGDTTDQNLNETLDVENKELKIRDSTEITKVIDVSKQKSKIDAEEINIQIKRKSQIKQSENKLTIKTSEDMIEPNADTLRDNNQNTDKNENQKEETAKEDKKLKEKAENNLISSDEDSPSNDKPENHSDDHLKQD